MEDARSLSEGRVEAPSHPVVRLVGVSVDRGGRRVLDRIDLEVARGAVVAVLGPSGVGKSTLLKLLTRELAAAEGTVELIGGTGAREGVVHQDAHLFGWLTIGENIALGQRLRANRHDPARIGELVDLLGLGEVVDRWPEQVSGGQAQRASLARALAISPDLLLLDEPFSALDPTSRAELQGWLRSAVKRDRLTAVIVTHDIDEALILADQIVLFGTGGTIVRRWACEPAADHAAAAVHPLRGPIRAGYADLGAPAREHDDEEWSGFADAAPEVTRGASEGSTVSEPAPRPGRERPRSGSTPRVEEPRV